MRVDHLQSQARQLLADSSADMPGHTTLATLVDDLDAAQRASDQVARQTAVALTLVAPLPSVVTAPFRARRDAARRRKAAAAFALAEFLSSGPGNTLQASTAAAHVWAA